MYWYFVQNLHEEDDSVSAAILRAAYEIHGSDVLEKWVPISGSLIRPALTLPAGSKPLTSAFIEQDEVPLMFLRQFVQFLLHDAAMLARSWES